jgi:hypothetical protein
VQVACRGQIFGTNRTGRSGCRRATSWSSVAELTGKRSTLVRSFGKKVNLGEVLRGEVLREKGQPW